MIAKALLLLVTLLISFVLVGGVNQSVLAQDGLNDDFCSGTGANTEFCQEVDSTSSGEGNRLLGPDGVLTQLAQLLVATTAALSVLMIVVAGLMFIFGSNNPQSVSRARSAVLYAIIGLAIAILSQMIVVFVLNQL